MMNDDDDISRDSKVLLGLNKLSVSSAKASFPTFA